MAGHGSCDITRRTAGTAMCIDAYMKHRLMRIFHARPYTLTYLSLTVLMN